MISERLTEAIKMIFTEYGEQVVEACKKILADNNVNASGKLSESFDFTIEAEDEKITLNILAEEYLKYMEQGRAAGKLPPVQSIIKWIEYKGIPVPDHKPGVKYGGQINSRGVKSYPGTRRGKPAIIRRNVKVSNEEFAFAIAHSISRVGTKGKGLIKPVMAGFAEPITEAIKEAVSKALTEDFTDILKDTNINFLTYTINF